MAVRVLRVGGTARKLEAQQTYYTGRGVRQVVYSICRNSDRPGEKSGGQLCGEEYNIAEYANCAGELSVCRAAVGGLGTAVFEK